MNCLYLSVRLIWPVLFFCLFYPLTSLGQTQFTSLDREVGQYRSDLKSFMKLSKNQEPQVQRNAIYNLCLLHHEVAADSRYQLNPTLQGFRVTIARRLEGYKRDYEKEILRLQRSLKTKGVAPQEVVPPTTPDEFPTADNDEETIELQSLATMSYAIAGKLSGGPTQMYQYAGGRTGGVPWESGQILIELIEKTIHPDTWRINGGEGTIEYYHPALILVVMQTEEAKDRMEYLIEQMRRLN